MNDKTVGLHSNEWGHLQFHSVSPEECSENWPPKNGKTPTGLTVVRILSPIPQRDSIPQKVLKIT